MASNTTETRRKDKRNIESELQRRDQPRPATETVPLRSRPANENDPGTSMMLAKLRRQPSFAPFYVAFGLSLGWVAAWFFVFSNSILAAPAPLDPRALPETMKAAALLALPIGIVWVTAYFLWRASQLRQVSEVLMQSAMRLIRPQDIATEGLTTIAQAVRNEVDLLVGGVEHAVQRAGALEEIVHKEISAIERAFGGNEDRIRGLVTGLENQRAALHQASLIINTDANPMLARLETNTQALDGIIGNAQTTLAKIDAGLKDTTVNLARSIDEAASRAVIARDEVGSQTSQMERMTGIMTGEMSNFSSYLQSQIEQLSKTVNVLNSGSVNFGQNVQSMETNVTQLIRQSVDQLTGINNDIGRTIERVSLASAEQIKQTTAGLADIIQTSGANLSYHLKATTDDVVAVIERSSLDSSQQIEQSRGLVTQGLQSIASDYLDRVAQARADLVTYVDGTSADLASTVAQTAEAIAGRLTTTGTQLIAGMDQTANNLLTELNSTTSGLSGRVEQMANRLYG